MKVLYLFPDTNVFIQCKPLGQLDWSSLGTWDSIQIVLTRPIQTEIDALKGKGNGRQSARARAASSMIRQLLDASDGCLTLRSKPEVRLCLRHDLRRDESVAGELNYEERDDQLVGIALAFQKSHPVENVWLLTNDTGPMASAKAVSLQYFAVLEDWLLQPEANETDKREKELQAELSKYKSAEPSFDIRIDEPYENQIEASITANIPLTQDEVRIFINQISTCFPISADFGSPEPTERPISQASMLGIFGPAKEVFTPATSQQIAEYKGAYEKWTHECEEVLADLHNMLNSRLAWPEFRARVNNLGSRPATDALVVVQVKGKFLLVPSNHEEVESSNEEADDKSLRLPRPPRAPKGTWKQVERYNSGIGNLSNLQSLNPNWQHPPVMSNLGFKLPAPHDPNSIYFKEGAAGEPSQSVEFTCEQWRHAQDAEHFEMALYCPLEPGTYSGELRITVHAANLTQPKALKLPLRIEVTEQSCRCVAEKMVAELGIRV